MAQLHLKALKHSAVMLPFAFNLGTTELDSCCRYQRRDRQKQTEGFFFLLVLPASILRGTVEVWSQGHGVCKGRVLSLSRSAVLPPNH